MLFKVKFHNLATSPDLSRVWIRTGDPKFPLKAVWINQSQLRRTVSETFSSDLSSEAPEFAEDHLALAA
jgi:hypothetical protein